MRNLYKVAMAVSAFLALGSWKPAFSTPTDHFFTTSDGVKLHYLEEGRGPWLIFIPGWTMPADIWEKQIRYFSEDCHVVALDPRCQGESEITGQGLNVLRRSQDIEELIQFLKAKNVALVGWSAGGTESLAYLKQYGARDLAALVLVDASPAVEPPAFLRAKREAFVRKMENNREKETGIFVRWMFAKPQPDAYYERIVQASLKTPTSSAAALLRDVNAFRWIPDPAHLDIPIYFIASDSYDPQGLWFKKQIPWLQLTWFKGAGHALFVDAPDAFNDKVHDFLTSVAFFPHPKPLKGSIP